MSDQTMTAEDAEMLAKYSAISPRPFTISFGEASRILATYHAIAASQQEVERLRVLLDMTYSREDQDRLAAIFTARSTDAADIKETK